MPFHIRLECDVCGTSGEEIEATPHPIDMQGTLGIPVPKGWYFGLRMGLTLIGDAPTTVRTVWTTLCPICNIDDALAGEDNDHDDIGTPY